MQCPAERDMQASASMNCSRLMTPALTSSLKRQTSVPEPSSCPQYLPLSIGPPDTTMAGTSQLAAPMTRDGRGLVAAAEQHDAVDGIGADGLFDVHADQVAVEHGRRAHVGLARGHDRELHRQPAGLPHAALHVVRDGPQVRVARRQLRPGIADADDRAAVEHVGGQPLVPHPAAVDEAVLVVLAEPGRRPVYAWFWHPNDQLPIPNAQRPRGFRPVR